jgi:hypothetical protein
MFSPPDGKGGLQDFLLAVRVYPALLRQLPEGFHKGEHWPGIALTRLDRAGPVAFPLHLAAQRGRSLGIME